jgi:hypothetical protein
MARFGLEPLPVPHQLPLEEMRRRADSFLEAMRRRRTVSELYDRSGIRDVIERRVLAVFID